MTDIKQFERDVLSISNFIRERVKLTENVNHIHFEIEVKGRPDSDLKIAYKLGEWSGQVEGNAVEPVLNEFLRRCGWDQSNKPLSLPNYSEVIPSNPNGWETAETSVEDDEREVIEE